jgi:hypothetical protein
MIEINLTELNQEECIKTNGGFRILYPGQTLIEYMVKSVLGAYNAGKDAGSEHCDCEEL